MRDGELDIHFTNGHGDNSTGSIHRDLLGMFRLREGDRPATGLEFARLLFVVEIARLGNPKDLLGCVLWLLSPASSFVTGITVPVDGGFSSYAGV